MTSPVLPVLDIRGLNKLFGRVTAAQDITVSVGAEEVVSIIGANGAGKTTFVNMITGYTRPTSGVIRFRGHDLIGLPPRAVTRLGVCRSFQVPQVFATLSVLENLMIAHGLAEPGRTALSTLATPARRADCEALLAIEHDIDIVERYGTRVLAFHEGRILADGPPGAVLVDPKIREHVTGRRAGRAEGAAPTVPAAGGPGRARGRGAGARDRGLAHLAVRVPAGAGRVAVRRPRPQRGGQDDAPPRDHGRPAGPLGLRPVRGRRSPGEPAVPARASRHRVHARGPAARR
jgi:ABC-type branched-subunit amino acid transport system ATPase component